MGISARGGHSGQSPSGKLTLANGLRSTHCSNSALGQGPPGSSFPEPFAIFGVPIQEYDAIFDEKLRLLVQLAAKDRATWSGRYWPALRDVPIVPRALQVPLPIWAGVGGSPGSAERAGRLGLPMVLGFIGGTFAHARHTIDIYRAAGEEAGHPEKLRVGLSTHFYAGATPSAALAVHPYYYEYLRPKTPGGRGWVVDPASFAAGTRRDQALMVGSVDQLVEKIVDAHQLLGADRFIGQVDWGGLPRALVEESITRLATEIAPQVRAAVGDARPGRVGTTAWTPPTPKETTKP